MLNLDLRCSSMSSAGQFPIGEVVKPLLKIGLGPPAKVQHSVLGQPIHLV